MSHPEPWTLEISPSAARRIEQLPEKAATALIEAIRAIAADPYRLGKPLRFELEGLHSARRGPYRVLYRIDDSRHGVAIVAIGHRTDVYRRRSS